MWFSLSPLLSSQLEGLPREDLIKYVKKQAQMVQKLKAKNEGTYVQFHLLTAAYSCREKLLNKVTVVQPCIQLL